MTPRVLRLRAAVPAIALVAVLVLPLLWWTKVAFVDVETEMLPPSPCGSWVVHPEWDIVFEPAEFHPPVAYRLEIPDMPLDMPLSEGPVAEIAAMGSFRVRLDGSVCGEFSKDDDHRRQPARVDLAACPGAASSESRSRLFLVEAKNDDGPAPVRVCWSGGFDLPATGEEGWWALTPARPWRPAAVAYREAAELLDKDFTWPAGPWGYRLLLVLLLVVGLVGLLRPVRSVPDTADSGRIEIDSRIAGPRGDVASWVVLLLAFGVYAWNASSYPWWASRVDQGAHAERIREAAEGLWLPSADRSFQSYQPPLYYAIAGSLAALNHPGVDLTESTDGEDLRSAQWLDAVAGTAHLLLAFWMLRRFGPASPRARALSLAVAGLAPVAVTTYPMLGNETLAACLCGTALVAGLSWAKNPRRDGAAAVGCAALAGAVAALAMLTKFTGLMPTAAIGVVLAAGLLSRNAEPGRSFRWRPALAWLTAVVVLAGPFFFGRWLRWGNPFIGNWDRALGYGWEGEPGYRTLGFFLRFGEVFFHAPERGMWSSFWDGLYASTWAEINDSFVPVGDPAVDTLQLLLMAFAVVPTLAALGGFVLTLRRAWTRPPGLDLAMVAVSTFTLSSVAVYTTRVPFANTVKALFLLSLLIPVTLFVARGYARMERGLGRARWLLDLAAALQVLLVLRLFVWIG